MNLGEFHSNVETTLNRGTTLTSRIPGRVKQAVMWLERNYTFSHMERFRLLQVVALDRTVDFHQMRSLRDLSFVDLLMEMAHTDILIKLALKTHWEL
jgi:hypothetical protein